VALTRRARSDRNIRHRTRGEAVLGLVLGGFLAISPSQKHPENRAASLGTRPASSTRIAQEFQSMKKNARLPSLLATASLASAANAQNLIVNGGFEQGPAIGSCSYIPLETASTALQGWQVVAGNIDYCRWTEKCGSAGLSAFAQDGQHLLDLNATTTGAIRQTIALVPGRVYEFSLQMSGNHQCGDAVKRVQVAVGPVVQEFAFTCSSSGWEEFEARSFTFSATSSTTVLEIRSLNPGACGAIIDHVALSGTCAADVIANGIVDGADLSALLSVWGTSGGVYPTADCNADGTVDGQDLAIVLSGWGACP
jgi:choice-of-anchor C domain-containing protein